MARRLNENQLEGFVVADSHESDLVSLREWRVEDFSAAYVSHRDHLVRYARRFLPDGWEAEEVVQDAFLYLMTALPELDSEIGVLRFLKWKTKMLAIDVSRSKNRSQETTLEALPEFEADDVDPVDSITRADDAAIVRLALAKLSDRQRDALIATQLEGKATEVVAQELGLSSNAFRQLLHRARAAFKVALVGEAEIRGLTASQILSIAARKAGSDTITKIGAASIFILMLSLLAPSMFTGPVDSQVAATQSSERLRGFAQSQLQPSSDVDATSASANEESPQVATGSLADSPAEESVVASFAAPTEGGEPARIVQAAQASEPVDLVNELDEMLLRLSSFDAGFAVSSDIQGSVVLSLGGALAASVAYDLESENVIQFVTFTLESQLGSLTAVPQTGLSVLEREGSYTTVTYAATDLLVGDFHGDLGFATSQESSLSRSGYLIQLKFGDAGQLISSSLELIPRI